MNNRIYFSFSFSYIKKQLICKNAGFEIFNEWRPNYYNIILYKAVNLLSNENKSNEKFYY